MDEKTDTAVLLRRIQELEGATREWEDKHFTLSQRYNVASIKLASSDDQLKSYTTAHHALAAHARRQQDVLGKTFRELNTTHTLLNEAVEKYHNERRAKYWLAITLIVFLLVVCFWTAYFVILHQSAADAADAVDAIPGAAGAGGGVRPDKYALPPGVAGASQTAAAAAARAALPPGVPLGAAATIAKAKRS